MIVWPEYIEKVIKTLKDHGHLAFLVGGCVRDMLLGIVPRDFDVATSANLDEVSRYFDRTIAIGARHGTMLVVMNGHNVEISAFKGGCIGDNGLVPGSLEEDLARRDFSINAMAMDNNAILYDPWGGQRDLKDKILRATADRPEERISEDPLRMMRAVRLSINYGLTIEPITYECILKNAPLLAQVSTERIREELNRILISDYPAQGIRMLQKCGLMINIIPEVELMVGLDQRNIRHDRDLFEHSLAVLEAVPPRLKVRLAALLHDIGKPSSFTVDERGIGHFYGHHLEGIGISRQILQRLKYERQMVEDVSRLVGAHMTRFARLRDASLKKLMVQMGEANLEDLFDLQRADIIGSAPPYEFAQLDTMEYEIRNILNAGAALQLKDLAVKGSDLIVLGYASGPDLGKALQKLLELVLDNPRINERDLLLKKAREWL